ncbi:DNA cytosine methyltransferase [Bacillus halotolerans]|uniref:DNA cytosine methyltransferase n=1 Tax=Bacillus halotolerans TaxID=260554 RepID=UPI0035A13A91
MKSIELFAGIGGIALAAEWVGIETVAFCEREPFCQKVLNKNFPGVPIFDDVRTLNRQLLEEKGVIEPGGTIDIISGGFPLAPSTPNIEEIELSLWPTPTVHGNYNKKGASKNSGTGLATAVKLFPTPTARDWKGRTGPNWNHQTLPDAVLWPTPRTKGMCGGTGSFQTMMDLQEKGVITEQERKQMTAGNAGQLNPTWVEWLMGFPTGWTELKD